MEHTYILRSQKIHLDFCLSEQIAYILSGEDSLEFFIIGK